MKIAVVVGNPKPKSRTLAAARRVVAVPLMLGAGPAHALAPDVLLEPVLVELGATCPTRGLYVLDSAYEDDGTYRERLERAAPQVTASVVGMAR